MVLKHGILPPIVPLRQKCVVVGLEHAGNEGRVHGSLYKWMQIRVLFFASVGFDFGVPLRVQAVRKKHIGIFFDSPR